MRKYAIVVDGDFNKGNASDRVINALIESGMKVVLFNDIGGAPPLTPYIDPLRVKFPQPTQPTPHGPQVKGHGGKVKRW